MSYLSTSENVGFSGIPQTISDASCATQYKMAVESVPASCSEVNMFINDNTADDQSYITQYNDNFYTKFKIDPNELYTFHDSDIIAGEVTVSQTDDIYMLDSEIKAKSDSSCKEISFDTFTNGDKPELSKEVPNGHFSIVSKPKLQTVTNVKECIPFITTTNTKIAKTKCLTQVREIIRKEQTKKEVIRKESSLKKEPVRKELAKKEIISEVRRQSVHSPKSQITAEASSCVKNSINYSVNSNNVKPALGTQSGSETFLDVFKREQGLIEEPPPVVKTESVVHVIKIPSSPSKKSNSGKTSQSKSRRGRGPALHEALQRIPALRKAIPLPSHTWHAPGEKLFSCGPLSDKRTNAFTHLESSSSEDDNIPDIDSGTNAVCVEECSAESRGTRLALRRAALRRNVARAHTAFQYADDYRKELSLAKLIKKQLKSSKKSCELPTPTVNHLLAMRGMPSILTSQERRQLRESGWSGGESGKREQRAICAEEGCDHRVIPCGRHCLTHVTRAPEQRLYASCAAVFAGGSRCNQPLLPLQDQTPLCTEHAWKRDNYDKLNKDCRPKKVVRARVLPVLQRGPRRPKKRRLIQQRQRLPNTPLTVEHSLSEINICSNSSNYDSSEDTTMGGALSENEYHVTNNGLEVEVGHVPHDDILDPSVLSQIPDEAFTEFFNQAENGTTFAESSELAAALEAVLDERGLDERALHERVLDERALHERVLDERALHERVLDERALENIADCVLTHHSPHGHLHKNKMQVSTSVPMELSSVAPS